MSDLEEFIEENAWDDQDIDVKTELPVNRQAVWIDDLGLFFWEKRNYYLKVANNFKCGTSMRISNMSLAKEYERLSIGCLGKDKVKELIKELKE
jgi:hypothetical protein